MKTDGETYLRILIVDDDEDDVIVLREALQERVFQEEAVTRHYKVDWVKNFEAALEAFDRKEHDVYFIDHDLGNHNGMELLSEAGARGVDAPLIMLTGLESPQLEAAAARAGAADYLVKQYINGQLIDRSIRYAMERKRAEHSLKQAYSRMEDLVQERTRELVLLNRALEDSNEALRAEIQDRIRTQGELTAIRNELQELVEERTSALQTANERLEFTNQQMQAANLQLANVLEELEAERARLSTIIANAPGAIVVADRAGKVLFTNPAADQLFGPIASLDEMVAKQAPAMFHSDGTPCELSQLPLSRSALSGESQVNQELILMRESGKRQYLLVNASPILDRNQRITGAIALYQDITARKLEEERARGNATRVEVQRRLMEYSEKERLSLAQELHDGPIQDLLALTYQISELRIASQEQGYASLTGQLRGLQLNLQGQIQQLRNFTSELRPPPVLAFGLEKAMRSHLERFSEKYPEIQVELNLDHGDVDLPEELRLVLFRIYQELLMNVARHSGSNTALVTFSIVKELAILEVRDQGKGFVSPRNWLDLMSEGHFGLVGVRERAMAVGGHIEIISHPGSGAVVRALIPLEQQKPELTQQMMGLV